MTDSPPILLSAYLAAGALLGLATGCGDDAPTDLDPIVEMCTTPRADRLLPLATGASWTYDVTDLSEPGAPTVVKTNTVEGWEDIGERKDGIVGFRVRTDKLRGVSVSWQEDRCTSVVRHREQSFDAAASMESDQFYLPSKLRVDESPAHLVLGARWTVSYQEVGVDPVAGETTVSKDEAWSVEAVGESITVPAGTFTTVQLRKVTSGDADKRFWFAAGVGKVKEEGEQREELRAFTLP